MVLIQSWAGVFWNPLSTSGSYCKGGPDLRDLRIAVDAPDSVFRAGVEKIIGDADDMEIVVVSDGASVGPMSIDVLVACRTAACTTVDLRGTVTTGEDVPVMVISDGGTPDEQHIADGANGVVDQDDPPELLAAALRCVSGGMYISRHAHISSVGPVRLELPDDDRVLLEMLVDGRSVIAIASERGYSRSSMHARMKDVYDEIGVSNRSHAIAWAARSDITTMAPTPPSS